MKRTILILSRIFIAGTILIATVESTTITSASYDAGSNVLTVTFSDSILTDNILLGRMAFDDDNGGPRPDVVFSGGNVLTEDSLSLTVEICMIYGGIIDQWTNPDPDDLKTRNIWGNDLNLVNALESLNLSSLQLVVGEGAFIRDNVEPFVDTDGNGVWSSAEQFTNLNNNSTWDDAEEFTDCGLNNDGIRICDGDTNWDDSYGNGIWDPAEVYIDAIDNDEWDPPEVFDDTDNNGVWDDAEVLFDDTNGNGVWDSTEVIGDPSGNGVWDDGESFEDANGNLVWDEAETYEDGFLNFPENGDWDFEDSNDNEICDRVFECEAFTDCGLNNVGIRICDDDSTWNDSYGNGIWDPDEVYIDSIDNDEYDPPEGFIDANGNGEWDDTESFDDYGLDGLPDTDDEREDDGVWFPGEELTDMNGNNVWDDEEPFIDSNINNDYDEAEPLVDYDGDNEFDEVSEGFTDCGFNNDGTRICDGDTNWDDSYGNGIWNQYEPTSYTTLPVIVSGQDVRPALSSANYDANINKLRLIFDRPVQFDQIPEDEPFPSDQNRPGNGNLDSGEDRNGNGVLDYEANINIFKVGFQDGSGNVKMLEGIDQIVQTADSDTIEIFLTRNDGKSLETTLDVSLLSMNLSEGAFLDTLYNPSASSALSVTTTLDSLPFLADSATYDISENKLLIFFRSKEMYKNRVVTDPAPIYSKIALSVGDSSVNLSGIDGTPYVLQDIILRIQQLMLADQRDLEMLINEMEAGDTLFLAIDEYAVYDENSNGNLEVINLPVTITSSDNVNQQPPKIVSSGIVYDADTDILTLPWNMGVRFFNEIAVPQEAGVSDYSDLEGIAFYDSLEDSIIMFDQGEVYYTTSNNAICIKLSVADAGLLENYPNRASLILTIDPFTFYSASPHKNGNEVVSKDSSFVVTYQRDNTAPMVNEVLFNVIDSTLTITLDELVIVDILSPEKLFFGGVEIDGEIVVDGAAQYVSSFSVKVSSSTYDNIISLNDNVKINPPFQSADSAFVNADSTFSAWIELEAHYGREFWIQSFEAFPPPPYLVFASLRSIGVNCDIYVDDQVWETKINSADLVAIVTAFDEMAPNDSSQGIANALREFMEASEKDTDNNGKIIFVFTDILDEFGRGRSDTKSTLFVHGYSTMIDILSTEIYSNNSDIIYLDADPMSLNAGTCTTIGGEDIPDYVNDPTGCETADATNIWDQNDDLIATHNAISHEYARMIMEHNQPDQENWIIEGVSTVLQKKMTDNVKFFGNGISPSITDGNQLTYIATGYQSLKGRKDKFNAYLFLSYLQEKYSVDGTGWDIIQAIARSDAIGIEAVSDALVTLGIETDVKDIFADYGMACYLDAVQADSLYNSRYSFEGFNLQTAPQDKPAGVLKWNALEGEGSGSPYTKKDIFPWSYNYLVMRGYSFDVDDKFQDYLSPDLNAEDSLVFNGYDGVSVRVKKLILKSSYSDPMNPDYEVHDFELDDQTSYGTLPVTTNSLFVFKDTLDNALYGVQNILLMIAKTDDAQPSTTYDFAISNIDYLPDFSDLYAYQNPGIQNYLDLYVNSERRVYDQFGNEGAVVGYSVTKGDLGSVALDSGSVALTELTTYGSNLDSSFIVIYNTIKMLSIEGTYNFTYQGSDQSGNLFRADLLTIVVDYYDPAFRSRIVAGNAEYNLPRESLDTPLMIAAGAIPIDRSVSLPEGFTPVTEIIMFGPNDKILKRSATIIFALQGADQTMSIYQLHRGEWRHIGAEITENSLQANTNSLGQFIVLSGLHGELDRDLVLPQQYTLYQNYPNPFNPVTNISFDLPEQGYVSLVVFDVMGREIVRIIDGQINGGHHKVIWRGKHNSGQGVSSGIYFYRLTAGDFQQTRKMLIIK